MLWIQSFLISLALGWALGDFIDQDAQHFMPIALMALSLALEGMDRAISHLDSNDDLSGEHE